MNLVTKAMSCHTVIKMKCNRQVFNISQVSIGTQTQGPMTQWHRAIERAQASVALLMINSILQAPQIFLVCVFIWEKLTLVRCTWRTHDDLDNSCLVHMRFSTIATCLLTLLFFATRWFPHPLPSLRTHLKCWRVLKLRMPIMITTRLYRVLNSAVYEDRTAPTIRKTALQRTN